jgi:hypothetical protein
MKLESMKSGSHPDLRVAPPVGDGRGGRCLPYIELTLVTLHLTYRHQVTVLYSKHQRSKQ